MLFIQSYLLEDFQSLKFKVALVVVMWTLVSIAIVIDLISGLRKAKEAGEIRSSIGFRQTVKKVIQYYSMLAFAVLFDCLIMLLLYIFELSNIRIVPFVSIASSLFLIFIEWRSFMEKSSIKQRNKFMRGATDLIHLLEHKGDVLAGIKEALKKKKDETN